MGRGKSSTLVFKSFPTGSTRSRENLRYSKPNRFCWTLKVEGCPSERSVLTAQGVGTRKFVKIVDARGTPKARGSGIKGPKHGQGGGTPTMRLSGGSRSQTNKGGFVEPKILAKRTVTGNWKIINALSRRPVNRAEKALRNEGKENGGQILRDTVLRGKSAECTE